MAASVFTSRRSKGNIALYAAKYNNGVINGSTDTRSKFFVVQQIFDPPSTSQSAPLKSLKSMILLKPLGYTVDGPGILAFIYSIVVAS